jgi:hypothetical protein
MEVDTPLGKDVLLVRSFSGTEAISQLFFFGLDMLSENDSISYDSIVGKNVTIRTTLADESDRYLNGFISRFAQKVRDHRSSANWRFAWQGLAISFPPYSVSDYPDPAKPVVISWAALTPFLREPGSVQISNKRI